MHEPYRTEANRLNKLKYDIAKKERDLTAAKNRKREIQRDIQSFVQGRDQHKLVNLLGEHGAEAVRVSRYEDEIRRLKEELGDGN